MTTQTEAMKLALMNAAPLLYQSGHKEESAACNAALLMLLAEQPARQEPKIGCVNHDCDKCKEQQQKPVAWMYQCSADSSGPVLMQHKKDWAESGSGLWTETPLYTSPPALATYTCGVCGVSMQMEQPAREWVGLTDAEIMSLVPITGHRPATTFARNVEAKLKEKNT